MNDGLSAYQLSLIRDALGQDGLDQGAMLLGGLRIGSIAPQLGGGDAELVGSVRRSTCLSAGVQRNAAQAIPDNAWTAVIFDTLVWDTDGLWAAGTPTILTVNTGGVYAIFGYIHWAANAVGQRGARIYINGAVYLAMTVVQATAVLNVTHNVCGVWQLNQGDTVEIGAFQTSGAPLNLLSALPAYGPTFSVARLV